MTEDRPIRQVYDRIATHFSQTREHPWPDVVAFLDGHEGDRGLDVGCGNGRHTEVLAEAVTEPLGVDVSRALLDAARMRAQRVGFDAEFLQGDATTLPVRTGRVDVAIYIATIHHLRERSARIRSLDELARVLHPDGVGLVSAWSTSHDRFQESEGFDTTIDWTLPDGETVPRFYHIYDRAEFEADIGESDLEILDSRVSSGNCYATVGRA